jgi:hypothetical protein
MMVGLVKIHYTINANIANAVKNFFAADNYAFAGVQAAA